MGKGGRPGGRTKAPGHETVIGIPQRTAIERNDFGFGEMDETMADDVTYRLFRHTPAGGTKGSPFTIKAESDDAAVRHAQKIASDVGAMLCRGTRMVAG